MDYVVATLTIIYQLVKEKPINDTYDSTIERKSNITPVNIYASKVVNYPVPYHVCN